MDRDRCRLKRERNSSENLLAESVLLKHPNEQASRQQTAYLAILIAAMMTSFGVSLALVVTMLMAVEITDSSRSALSPLGPR